MLNYLFGDVLNRKDLKAQLNRAVNHAGARYTPGIDHYSEFPSIDIESLIGPLEALVGERTFWSKVEEIYENLSTAAEEEYTCPISKLQENYSTLQEISESLLSEIAIVKSLNRNSSPFDESSISNALEKFYKAHSEIVTQLRNFDIDKSNDLTKTDINSARFHAKKYAEPVGSLRALLRTQALSLHNSGSLLLLGPGGSGKTHFLCDWSKTKHEAGLLTVLCLAESLSTEKDRFMESILEEMDLEISPEKFLKYLNSEGKKRGRRSVIIIDGINESEREYWENTSEQVLSEIRGFPWISLILSCRTPMEQVYIADQTREEIPQLYHPGFSEDAFNAQNSFFDYYHISPEFPLLYEEFSNPLFLKIFCEAVKDAGEGTPISLAEIQAGQHGMTKILEDFVKSKRKMISKGFNDSSSIFTKPNWLWTPLYKNSFAKVMAQANRTYLEEDEVRSGIQSILLDNKTETVIRRKLLDEGLLRKTARFEGGEAREVFVFPYQRFSDHLIMRYLTDSTDLSNPDDVWALLSKWEERGDINLIEALMIEFPQRVQGEELLYVYRNDRISSEIIHAFLEGLAWRRVDDINRKTKKLILRLFEEERLQEKILDILSELSLKPNHSLDSDFFFELLDSYSIADRDLLWSEYLRTPQEHTSIGRLIEWIIRQEKLHLDSPAAKRFMKILHWVLCSTNISLRDKASVALRKVGELSSSDYFATMKKFFEVDDPYVHERSMGVLYALVLIRVNSKDHDFIGGQLNEWASWLYENTIKKHGRHTTTNIQVRDYAVSILEVACSQGVFSSHKLRHAKTHPMPVKKAEKGTYWRHDKEARSREENSLHMGGFRPYLHMDSARYLLGPIGVNEEGEEIHKETVLKAIWKIKHLGWNKDQFKEVDSEIDKRNFRVSSESKIDRYGKKYFWIAYRQLIGYYQSRFEYDEETVPEVISEKWYRDIDLTEDLFYNQEEPPLSFSFLTLEKTFYRRILDVLNLSEQLDGLWLEENPLRESDLYAIQYDKNDWILLTAGITYTPDVGRSGHIFCNAVFVDQNGCETALGLVDESTDYVTTPQNYFVWLLESGSPHYRFPDVSYQLQGDGRRTRLHYSTWGVSFQNEHPIGSLLHQVPMPNSDILPDSRIAVERGKLHFIGKNEEVDSVYFENKNQYYRYIRKDKLSNYLSKTEKRLAIISTSQKMISQQAIESYEHGPSFKSVALFSNELELEKLAVKRFTDK